MRLGAFPIAAAGLIPKALASLPPHLNVTLREAPTPSLVRALRAGTLDLAVIASSPPFRPPEGESPALELINVRHPSDVRIGAAGEAGQYDPPYLLGLAPHRHDADSVGDHRSRLRRHELRWSVRLAG